MKGKPGKKEDGKRGRVRTELSIQIGKVARDARLKLKLTQEDIAERVGLTPEVYGRLERGDMLPSTPTLTKICVVLGISADAVVGLAEPEATQAQPAPDEELPPEIRRLLRMVRTMDDEQLAIFKGTAAGLLKLNKRRQQQYKRDKAQVAII
ncbi:helix-turn-helix domain-containing protein [Archangium violaceum]|uniref:helix-turn-helix domain-containing protein n=1 Tax=Archangium violaceum TaxID=83451 RepID=UPI0036DEDC43